MTDQATKPISEKLREHVEARGGPPIENSSWHVMLQAADEIDRLNTITKPQIEAAAQAILNEDEGEYPLDQHENQHWFRDAAKAALVAAGECE